MAAPRGLAGLGGGFPVPTTAFSRSLQGLERLMGALTQSARESRERERQNRMEARRMLEAARERGERGRRWEWEKGERKEARKERAETRRAATEERTLARDFRNTEAALAEGQRQWARMRAEGKDIESADMQALRREIMELEKQERELKLRLTREEAGLAVEGEEALPGAPRGTPLERAAKAYAAAAGKKTRQAFVELGTMNPDEIRQKVYEVEQEAATLAYQMKDPRRISGATERLIASIPEPTGSLRAGVPTKAELARAGRIPVEAPYPALQAARLGEMAETLTFPLQLYPPARRAVVRGIREVAGQFRPPAPLPISHVPVGRSGRPRPPANITVEQARAIESRPPSQRLGPEGIFDPGPLMPMAQTPAPSQENIIAEARRRADAIRHDPGLDPTQQRRALKAIEGDLGFSFRY